MSLPWRSLVVGSSPDDLASKRAVRQIGASSDEHGLWPGKVMTEPSGAVPFWEAEPEHQDYLPHYPNGYTCHFPRPGWKLPHGETAV
jgi:peptide-methionine (S)-S-oxide reductase